MIREFRVKNFLSIADEQALNFVAKGSDSEIVAEVAEGVYLYKLGILYGANASGKSNMLKALNVVFKLMIEPQAVASKKIEWFMPFELAKDEPTTMYVSFYVEGVRYDYEIIYNKDCILREELYYYPNKVKALFYERTYVGDKVQANIRFGGSLKLMSKTQDGIRENTLNNHSVLSVCNKVAFGEDIEPLKLLFNAIMGNYHEVDGDDSTEKSITEILTESYSDNRKRRFFNYMLRKADLNIAGYSPIEVEHSISKEFEVLAEKGDGFPEMLKRAWLKTEKTITFKNQSDKGDFDIPLRLQSKGTLKYIRIQNALYDMITGSHVYYLDELGEDLHYDLLFFYLNVFLYNSGNSQLIITSQETALLSQDLINDNRGAIWFVEKNRKTASSEYARGDSFGLHENLSLYNSYRIGRLGAKPELGSIFIDLED